MRHLFKMPRQFKVTLIIRVPYYVLTKNEESARQEAAKILTKNGFLGEVELTVEKPRRNEPPCQWLTPKKGDRHRNNRGGRL